LLIFPNPSPGNFKLTSGYKIKKGVVQVFNALGATVFEEEIFNTSSMEIHLENISSGIYFVKVMDEEKQYIQKLIKDQN